MVEEEGKNEERGGEVKGRRRKVKEKRSTSYFFHGISTGSASKLIIINL